MNKIQGTTKSCKIFMLFLFVGFKLLAQMDCNHFIRGKILDVETKAPLPYVSVKVKGIEKYAITDLKGEFVIEGLCSDKNILVISCFGYCDTECEHHHQHGKVPHIYLTQKVLELSDITISAKKNKEEGTQTIAQTTIKKAEISDKTTQSLASVIAEQQGVTLTSSGTNVQLPVIHGLYGNRILILNNGLKHGFQNWGTDHAPEIDIASASSITVLKGAAGVRFGPEALGGAIVVESNPLYFNEPFYTSLGTGYQTNGRGMFTNLETGKGSENWSYFIGGNYTKIGDRKAPDYYLTNSGKEEKSVNLGIRHRLEDWDFKIYGSYVNQNLALLRTSVAESGNAFVRAINSDTPIIIKPFSYDINEPNQLTQHFFAKAEVNWWYSNGGKLTFTAGQQLNKREEYDVRRNADKPIIDLDLITSDYQLEWKHPDWFKLDGIIGVQFFTQNNDNNPGTGTTAFIPNYNTQRVSAFMIESLRFGNNTFEAGIRLDHENNDVRGRETNQNTFGDNYNFTNLSASLGYIKEISESSTLRTNFGTAWRTPNMAELFSFGQHGFKTNFGLLRYYTNEEGALRTNRVIAMEESAVDPEKGYKFITEFHTHKNTNTFTITAYSHYIQHYIFNRPYAVVGSVRGPMPVFVFDQADAFFVGTDVTWKKEWSDQFSGTFGMSYLWSQNISDQEALINQPPLSANYELAWKQSKLWKFEASKLSIKPSYTFQQFQAPRTVRPDELIDGAVAINPDSEIFDFKDAPEGYFLLDLVWRFKWKDFNASIAVNNLLNTKYRDYLNEMRYFSDEPGTNVLFSLNYIFKHKHK